LNGLSLVMRLRRLLDFRDVEALALKERRLRLFGGLASKVQQDERERNDEFRNHESIRKNLKEARSSTPTRPAWATKSQRNRNNTNTPEILLVLLVATRTINPTTHPSLANASAPGDIAELKNPFLRDQKSQDSPLFGWRPTIG
jgi:hypothetical protein